VRVGGRVAMPPRHALGVWWTRWFDFGQDDVMPVVDEFAASGMPLDT